jgi:lipid II:glycine glycyltransferase (peptidoglycan interpeptide bridge formation enzyme)
MVQFIKNPDQVDKQCWSEFVINHPAGTIFQTPEMVTLYNLSNNHKPIVIAAVSDDNSLSGILVAVIQTEHNGLLGRLSSRAIVWGGPLVLNSDIYVFNGLISEFDKKCKQIAIYSQFRNTYDFTEYKSQFLYQKYHYEEHLDIIFDLQVGLSVLWNGIHPTRKKQINRGYKREIRTKVIDSLSGFEFENCYDILKQVYKDAKLPCPARDYLLNAVNIFEKTNRFKTIVAIYKDQIVGFRFFLCYNSVLYDWYAGSLKDHYDKYPNDILPWELITWGVNNGYKSFDFGGAGNPGKPYGVRDFKSKFGGNIINFGRYEKIYNPLLFRIAKIGFSIWRHIK